MPVLGKGKERIRFPVRKIGNLDDAGKADINSNFDDIYRALQKVDELLGRIQSLIDEVRFRGNRVEEAKTHQYAIMDIIYFTEEVDSIEIYHAESEPKEFIINGMTISVPPRGWRSLIGGNPSRKVRIPGGVECVVLRLE